MTVSEQTETAQPATAGGSPAASAPRPLLVGAAALVSSCHMIARAEARGGPRGLSTALHRVRALRAIATPHQLAATVAILFAKHPHAPPRRDIAHTWGAPIAAIYAQALALIGADPAALAHAPDALLDQLRTAGGTVQGGGEAKDPPPVTLPTMVSASVIYIGLVLAYFLHDHHYTRLAQQIVDSLVNATCALNKRFLDPLLARLLFLDGLVHERLGCIEQRLPTWIKLFRKTSLQHDVEARATLYLHVLRHYVLQRNFPAADAFLQANKFPAWGNVNLHTRYLYYAGLTHAVYLDYTPALDMLLQASRRVSPDTAPGFALAVQRLVIFLQLLTGEVPDRSVFEHPVLRTGLVPYLKLVRAVRAGDLIRFVTVAHEHRAAFHRARCYRLVQRIHYAVIISGIRAIAIAYRRISLPAICQRLGLAEEGVIDAISHQRVSQSFAALGPAGQTPLQTQGAQQQQGMDSQPEDVSPLTWIQDTYSLVAKAIRDGVIDAQVDPVTLCVTSTAPPDAYATREPQAALHDRIRYCLDLYHHARLAMQYPDDGRAVRAHSPSHDSQHDSIESDDGSDEDGFDDVSSKSE